MSEAGEAPQPDQSDQEVSSSQESGPQLRERLADVDKVLSGADFEYPPDELDPTESLSGPLLDYNDETLTPEVIKEAELWLQKTLGGKPEDTSVRGKFISADGETNVKIYDVPLGQDELKYYISKWQNEGEKPSYILWSEEAYDEMPEFGFEKSRTELIFCYNCPMEKRESVLLVPILSVEALLRELRKKYDPSFLHRVPPHITILYPFKSPDEIGKGDIAKFKSVFSKVKGFSFILQKINNFPGVVFLEPSERGKFIDLTQKIVKLFPQYLPYEGEFEDINPHLTVGNELDNKFEQALEDTKRELESKLPIKAQAKEVWLMESENKMWTTKEKFPLLL